MLITDVTPKHHNLLAHRLISAPNGEHFQLVLDWEWEGQTEGDAREYIVTIVPLAAPDNWEECFFESEADARAVYERPASETGFSYLRSIGYPV